MAVVIVVVFRYHYYSTKEWLHWWRFIALEMAFAVEAIRDNDVDRCLVCKLVSIVLKTFVFFPNLAVISPLFEFSCTMTFFVLVNVVHFFPDTAFSVWRSVAFYITMEILRFFRDHRFVRVLDVTILAYLVFKLYMIPLFLLPMCSYCGFFCHFVFYSVPLQLWLLGVMLYFLCATWFLC